MKWSEILEYDGKNLIWKHRPIDDFKSKSAWVNTNSRFEGKIAGRVNCSKGCVSYIQVTYKSKRYLAHRIIWEMHFGGIPYERFIDHIDGNGTNNRIDNLRLVDRSGNARNYPINSSNTSGITGVYPLKKKGVFTGMWAVNIHDGNKQIYLGCFKNISDAAKVRYAAEAKYGYHENHGRRQ